MLYNKHKEKTKKTAMYGWFFMLLLIPVISGCASLKDLDEKLGDMFFSDKQSEEASSNEYSKITDVNKLSQDIKNKIDKWLEDNNLNRYGDPVNTMYSGGTPLFNEETGERIDRFEYILNKVPGVVDKIKKDINN